MNFEQMTLENVGDGELQTVFEDALAEVLRDIDDPRKVRTETRTITLTVQIKPHETDSSVDVIVSGSTKLAKRRAVRTLGMVDATGNLLQHRNKQQELPLGNVSPFPATAEKEETP